MMKISALMNQIKTWIAYYFPIWAIRRIFLRQIKVWVGRGSYIEAGTVIREYTVIGEDSYIGNLCKFEGRTRVGNRVRIEAQCHITSHSIIEDGVFLGPMICSGNDIRMTYLREGQGQNFKGIRIKRFSRIGAATMILPGTTIGEYAVVGAGAVVVRDVKPHSLAVGS
ncbi:MAG: DapH/DapD/GlmU-related protein, partial [Candidatus Thorarchaeota archaeon]